MNLEDYWNSEFVPKHRRGISDMRWAEMQIKRDPIYMVGDVIEFKEGGFGVIAEVSSGYGWPTSYSINPVVGLEHHPETKIAWFYEGDIKRLVQESNLRKFRNINN